MKGKRRNKKDKDRRIRDEIASGLRVMKELKRLNGHKRHSTEGQMNDLLYNLENKKEDEQ